jgi:formylglycine-generating enzyme required for sulfatase activity
MVQVFIPEGEFLMGVGKEHQFSNSPQHTVYLDTFWMDQVEVTNAMYLKCIRAGGCSDPVTDNIYYDKWVYRNYPMIYVVWDQAQEYCQWAGRRLPTEAEWEKAARGASGNTYPWGEEPPTPRLANFDEAMILEAVPSYRYRLGASPYGALNMAGNVREWVADWFDPEYYTYSPYSNPTGPASGDKRSLRGGSYVENYREIEVFVRYSHNPESAGLNRGFRCAQSAE